MSYEEFPPRLRKGFLWMQSLATEKIGEHPISAGEREHVMSTLGLAIDYFNMKRNYVEEAHFIEKYRRFKKSASPTIWDVRYALPDSPLEVAPRLGRDYGGRRLERKIMALEHELSRLRSNPALEKKVTKLEKELQKIRVASVVNLEGNEREQKDMLKNYKEAEKRAFVIMPFAPIYDDVWKGGIERACNSEEFGYLRVDKISLSSWITEDIVNYIEMADFVITDISGNNPNVMFELGWALAKDKKPIVIRQQDDPNKVPFDVRDIRYISYINSWSGIERLYRDICKFLKTTSEIVKKEATKKKTRQKKST